MSVKLFVTVYFMFSRQCVAKTVPENQPIYNIFKDIEQNDNAIYTECLKNIKSKYFCHNNIQLIVSSFPNIDNIIKPMHSQSSVSIKFLHRGAWNFKSHIYLFFAKDTMDLESVLTKIQTDISWKPAAKMIVLLEDIRDDDILLRELFAKLMDFNIYNVIALVKTTTVVNIYTYFPFNNNYCGRKFDNVINLGNCAHLKDIELFPDISNGLKNCTLVVAVKEGLPSITSPRNWDYKKGPYYEGFEQKILNELALLEGISLEYKYIYNENIAGDVYPNGTTTGLFRLLQNGTADIIAGSLPLTLSRASYFDYVMGYDLNNVVLFTSSELQTKVHPQLSGITCFLILFSYLVICIITMLVYKHPPDQPQDNVKIMFKLYGYFFGHVDQQMFKQKQLKILLISWIWFGMFITIFYSSSVSSTMIVKNKAGTTFLVLSKELDQMFLEPCVYEDMINYYEIGRNRTIVKGKMRPECLKKKDSLSIVATTKGMYTFAMDYDFDFVQRGTNIEISKKPIDLGYMVSAMYTRKGFLLKKRLNDYFMEVFEKGLVKQHLKLLHLVYGSKESVKKLSNEFGTYTLHDIVMHLKILICGYIVSFLCFIIERIKIGHLN